MGIRFRIILIIIIVMSMISLSVYFLGDNVNTRILEILLMKILIINLLL